MIVSTLKSVKQVETVNNRSLGIQSYGESNDMPQKIAEIVNASVTGKACYENYRKFIYGRGFADSEFFGTIVNSRGDTADSVLLSVANDFAMYGGFALHLNYNANFEISSVAHIPFETIRFEALDDNYRFSRLALHPDWGKRNERLRRFKKDDIEFFNEFNPDPDVIAKEVNDAGGWGGYKGQIYYYSGAGDNMYPMPIFAAALTDMSNEEGLSNITNRNVRHNFLPAGMYIDKNNAANSDEQEEDTKNELTAFQGDLNAGKLLYVNLRNGEEPPEFKAFDLANTDKDFERAESKTPDIIGSAFVQPPILRAKDVGANFGSDLMKNAYDFYNAQTETERIIVESVFREIFSLWYDKNDNTDNDYSILPKIYRVNQTLAEKLGTNTDKVIELIFNDSVPAPKKRVILNSVYGIDDEDIDKLLEE